MFQQYIEWQIWKKIIHFIISLKMKAQKKEYHYVTFSHLYK